MIPKVIHYCWFGRKEKPQSVMEYISSWKRACPDYAIKEWNEDNFDIYKFPYTREAYMVGKYAFVSDVARLYALQLEGGIYLDTDVKLLKSFDDFLNYRSFIGMETPFWVSTAVIGAEANVSWVKDFYDTYTQLHFIRKSGLLKTIPNTFTLSQFLHQRFPHDEKDLNIYPMDFFSPKIYATQECWITENTVAVHDFAGTWLSPISTSQRLRNLMIRYVKK